MITVNKTAETLQEGISNMLLGAKEDYERFTTRSPLEGISNYGQQQLDRWDDLIKVKEGKKYIKVIRDGGVFAFICKTDFKHFRKGDVLKPASWNTPALNQPRGNVLRGNYPIQWTGPLYL